jgi:hypothetical protein
MKYQHSINVEKYDSSVFLTGDLLRNVNVAAEPDKVCAMVNDRDTGYVTPDSEKCAICFIITYLISQFLILNSYRVL